jgi:hypothetical protein
MKHLHILSFMGCALLISAHVFASEDEHRQAVHRLLMIARANPSFVRYPVLSDLYLMKERGNFTHSTGRSFLYVPDTAYSAYDDSVSYRLTPFYTPKNTRFRGIVNYFEPNKQWLLSLGYDSGLQADKLSVSPSTFIGLAKSFEIDKANNLSVSWGQWFGGKVTERPCLDAYDRQYWCPNLSAWIDRPALDTSPGKYYELKYQWLF